MGKDVITEEESKYYSDKRFLETNPNMPRGSAVPAMKDGKNYDLIRLEQRGRNHFKEMVAEYNTWVDIKCDFDIVRIKKILNLKESDLKELWKTDQVIAGKEQRKTDQQYRRQEKQRKQSASIFSRTAQAETFIASQPLYYDKARIWWMWDNEELYWDLCDETDILNMVSDELNLDVVPSKTKVEILTALELVARKQKPTITNDSWIQFKNGLVDLNNPDNIFVPNSSYFVTNPLPWKIGESEDTPKMDEIFEQWVGREYVETLYQILAYSILPAYPLHRIFCFIGGGMNGKSCFLNLLRKFVGNKNVTSTELDTLLNSRFEVTRLHKKLICQMGETNFAEMNKTSMLKKLSGGDLIGFEYKRKDPFEDKNYAKIIIATNNLPATSDKTIGFYRRWMIIDFPNQFSEKKDILSEIPDVEYENLGKKCIRVLKDLLDKKEFHKEGSVEDRMKNYEDKSNPLGKFLKEFTEEDADGYIWKWEFEKKLNEWCKENRFRQISDVAIGKKMKDINIYQIQKNATWGEMKKLRAWSGIKWQGELVK